VSQGIYRIQDWAVLQADDGTRSALRREEYEACSIQPEFARLETDVDYHVHVLERGGTYPGPAARQ
jgi:hypothetical protein